MSTPIPAMAKLNSDIDDLSKGLPIYSPHRRVVLATYIRTLEKENEDMKSALNDATPTR